MNAGLPALPPQLINPSLEYLEQAARDEGVIFAQDTAFLHKGWLVYSAQAKRARDPATVRSGNLFWRIWSKPSIQVSNQQFNRLWERCQESLRQDSFEPYQSASGRAEIRRLVTTAGDVGAQIPTGPDGATDAPHDPFSNTATWPLSESVNRPDQTTSRPCVRGNATGRANRGGRPSLRRNTSSGSKSKAATVSTVNRGRGRPSSIRRRSQNTSQQVEVSGASQLAVTTAQLTAQPQAGLASTRSVPAQSSIARFELGEASSWQSEDSGIETAKNTMNVPAATGSLTEKNFRKDFLEKQQREASATNLTSTNAMRKNQSSVRFADDVDTRGDLQRGEGEPGSALTDSDDEDEASSASLGLRRNTSNLSRLIKDRRRQSGSQDLGPGQPAPEESRETRDKRRYLLDMGRAAGAHRGPTRQPGSGEDDRRYRSPSPGATF